MSNRKLVILGTVAVLMVIWAVVQSRVSSKPKAGAAGLAYLIQGLDPADVDRIVLGTGEDVVTLRRTGGRFVVVNKDNYPTKASAVSDLFTKCMEIQRSEFVTDNPANHEDLEVTEEKARIVVRFLKPDPNSPLLAGVVIGKTKELGQGTYVRLLPGDEVYVAPTVPWFGAQAINYIEQGLVSTKREDIASVTVNSPGGEYTLKPKEDSQDVVLESLPAGKKLKSSDSRSVFNALTSLRCDDVSKDGGELTFDRQFICILKDSTVYTIKIAKKDDKTYAVCEVDFMDKTPVEMKPVAQGGKVESEEELKKKEAKLLAHESAIKFAARHKGWVYQIPEWKAKNLTKELSDLIEDEEKPKEEDAAEDSDAVEPNAVEAES